MSPNWNDCKNLFVIRPDNMGDLLMSTPAIRALKETFSCRITVLTSSMAAGVAAHIPEISEVLVYDLPWVKLEAAAGPESFMDLAALLKKKAFDAAVVFTVYSQNPAPAILLAWLAGIPRRLAYCRENPYHLLTDWLPDPEPYTLVRHQVARDLALVAAVGANTKQQQLSLNFPEAAWSSCQQKLQAAGVSLNKPWLVLHAGVSEPKRAYPEAEWIKGAQALIRECHMQVLFTGGKKESQLTEKLAASTGTGAFSLGGVLQLEEFMLLLKQAPLLVSVNSGPVHLAAAAGTPVVVLYATSNPQHLPWQATGAAFFYDIPAAYRSRNEVVRYVQEQLQLPQPAAIAAEAWVAAAKAILSGKQEPMPLLAPLKTWDA